MEFFGGIPFFPPAWGKKERRCAPRAKGEAIFIFAEGRFPLSAPETLLRARARERGEQKSNTKIARGAIFPRPGGEREKRGRARVPPKP